MSDNRETESQLWTAAYLVTNALIFRTPEMRREERRLARQRQRKAQRQRERIRMNSPTLRPKTDPAPDNRPNEQSKCPRCKDRSDGFRWSPREYTYRCNRCRVPLKFVESVPQLNFDRTYTDPIAGGWRIPDSAGELRNCILVLGTKLLNGPRIGTELKQELIDEGHKRKAIDRAYVSLRLRAKQQQRPGPLWWHMPENMRAKVLAGAVEEMLTWLDGQLPK